MSNTMSKSRNAALMQGMIVIADAISSRIMSSELSRAVKEDILTDIATWPLVLEGVAHRQNAAAAQQQRAGPRRGRERKRKQSE
jgi:hypothetical protein